MFFEFVYDLDSFLVCVVCFKRIKKWIM